MKKYQIIFPACWVICMKAKKLELKTGMEQWTGSKLGKIYVRAVYFYPALFNIYPEYILKNAGKDEAQTGIKIARRNINNLWYADDKTLRAERKEELKSILVKVKEESEKVGLKLNIHKPEILASSPINLWQIDGGTMETVRLYILGLQNHCRWWMQPWS